jgi:hypothetical protein
MDKKFCYPNGIVRVIFPKESNHEELEKVVETFVKETIKWRVDNGNCNTSTNIGEK